jgi:hypothetical protein
MNLLGSYLKIVNLLIIFYMMQHLSAQSEAESTLSKNLYRPRNTNIDTLKVNPDTINPQQQYITDSINTRIAFVKDSILAREKFVHDSIQRRKEIIDSLNFLLSNLPRLLDASIKTFTDQIIISTNKVSIVGDSTLTDYSWVLLPFSMDQPFVPWKSSFNLSTKPIKFTIDTINKKITSVETHLFKGNYLYIPRSNAIRIDGTGSVISNKRGQFYKIPVDTVFFDSRNRVTSIKRYLQLYQAVNFKKGTLITSYLYQVKQYEYGIADQFTKYKVVNFCERWTAMEPNKVCSIINYTLSPQGKSVILTRTNDPVNEYSDGVFNFEFEGDNTLKSASFSNKSKSDDWKIIVELNETGNVSRYVYQTKGDVHRTLLINYYLNDPKAKYKVETITCTFEDDGVSYYQVNNTTGKSRNRDKMTGEWGPWK